jgi:hypothetical protein
MWELSVGLCPKISTPLIAFESIVHKIAIFSDELENVKQLNTSFQ